MGPEKSRGCRPLAPHLGCLQVLQHKVPELGRGVQQQELEASRGDAGWLSGLSTGDGERDNAPIVRERPQSPLVLSHLQVYHCYTPLNSPFQSSPSTPDPPRCSVQQGPKNTAKQGTVVLLAFSPLHEPSLAEELSQVLADSCTGGAHHEVQDHLRNARDQRESSGPREVGAQAETHAESQVPSPHLPSLLGVLIK